MKKLLFLVLVLSSFHPSAQQVKWSNLIEDKDYSYIKIIGENDDGFYVLKSNLTFEDERDRIGFRSRKYSIAFYTNDMVLKWSHHLEAPYIDGRIVSVNMVNDRVLVAHSFTDKKEKIYRLYACYLNDNGEYIQEGKPGASVVLVETSYGKLDDREKPDIYISQNHARMACAFKTIPESKEQQDYHVFVMDTALSILYKKDFVVPFREKGFVSQSLTVSNTGGFYLFGTRFSNDKKQKGPNESFYMTYYCTSSPDEVHTQEIKIDSKFLTDASLTYDNLNHKIVVAGFFSEYSAYSIAGTFYYGLRTDTAMTAEVRTAAFEPEFLLKFRAERKENNNRELTDYLINRVILRQDGGVVIVAEGLTVNYSSYYDYFSQMYITHKYYLYGNIITLSVNPDGKIHWGDVITKQQESRDDGAYYSSYCSNIARDKMFFIYNKYITDHPSVLLSTVNSRGEQKTDVLFNEEEHVLAVPFSGKQISEDELVMPAMKEGKLRFVKITF